MAFKLEISMKNCSKRAGCLLALIGSLCAGFSLADTSMSPYGFPLTKLQIGMHVIQAEIAATQSARMQGLMYRQQLKGNEGMVFLFDRPSTQCMWMKNTYVPLSVAFIDAAGKVTNIEDMEPETENNHCSSKHAKYALEMTRGWFAQHGIKSGTLVKGLESVK